MRDGDVVILVGIALLIVASMTMVIGLMHSSMDVVYLSLGGNVVAGIALAVSAVRARPTAGAADAMVTVTEEPASPHTRPAQTPAFDHTVVHSANGSPEPWAAWFSDTHSDGEHSSISAPATRLEPPPPHSPRPWTARESPVELTAPGVGLLGRLRRRPLAERETPHPPLTTRAGQSRPKTRRSSGDRRSTASRPKSQATRRVTSTTTRSTPGPPKKAAGGPKRAATSTGSKKAATSTGSKRAATSTVRVPAGLSRPRPTGKAAATRTAATRKAATGTGPSRARKAPGAGSAGQAPPARTTARN